MKTTKLYLFLAFFPVMCIAQSDELYFTSISLKDGLSQGVVYCIYQDQQGFMWFGTGDGLNKYDGYNFTVYKHHPFDSTTISNSLINCITSDHFGNLWIGTTNGLNRYDPKTEKFKHYLHQDGDQNSISNNYIKSLFIDSKNDLWIGTDQGLNRLDLTTGKIYRYNFDGKLNNSRIFSILEDHRGDIWLATAKSGLIRFNPTNTQYTQFTYQADNNKSISSNHVNSLYEDSKQELWIGTWEYGVSRFNQEKEEFERLKTQRDGTGLNNEQIRCIIENDGNIWIGTFEGLNIYNPNTMSFTYYLRNNNVSGTLSYNIINCLFRDKAGSIWIGTNGGGINLYDLCFGQFKLIDPKMKAAHNYGSIGPIVENKRKLWIGTEGGGLAFYDLITKDYEFYNLNDPSNMSLNSNTIRALCVDRDNRLWIGTYAAGIKTFNLETLLFEKHFDKSNGIDNNIVNVIYQDAAGTIWVGSNTEAGIHFKESTSDKFTAGYQSGTSYIDLPWIRAIFEPSPNEYWFGSIYNGIFIYKNDKRVNIHSNFSSDYISVITKDSKNRLWVGTYGGGVNIFHPEDQTIKTLTVADGLLNDNICSIIEDSLSNFWISTIAGISAYDEETGVFMNFSYQKGNFPIENLNLRSGLYASDGHIYYGGNNGLTYFNPQAIRQNKFIPPVVITQLLLNNKPVRPFDETCILNTAIHLTPEIVLKHHQTNITVEFAALNFIYPQNNQYMFQLAGYDRKWIDAGFQRHATYTNLPAGKYVFHVKASNSSGIWNETGTRLVIRILPPPWRTWWAYLIYLVLIAGIMYAVFSYIMSQIKLKNDIRLKQLEKVTLEQTHQMRINLFTNFSHELRTPLTLILDPLKHILSDTNYPSSYKEPLHLMYKSAKKILYLVNQLMDFRKQESGRMEVKVKEGDVIKFLQEIVIIFHELTRARNVKLQFYSTEQEIRMFFDPFLLEKVFYNILSNAVKNTPENGMIRIDTSLLNQNDVFGAIPSKLESSLCHTSTYIEFIVKDTGKGIRQEDLEKIFDPFYQVVRYDTPGIYGTGIGLNITKGIVELHHGVVWAESKPNEGATFKIILPVDQSLYSKVDFVAQESHDVQQHLIVEKTDQHEKQSVPETNVKKGLPIILVIDDNDDIRSYIRNRLQSEYKIYEAEDGVVGLQRSQELIPDLIVSDIMMPKLNGLDLSKQLKNDVKTAHIPIILLSARTTILQIKEGLDVGADDYLTKPFDADLLKAKVKSIIENRKRLKEAYIRSFNVDLPSPLLNNMDKVFLNQAYNYIKDHLDNSELTIEEFGKQLRLSRTQLYRKIKALTDMSPSMFISTLRLKVAAELLAETNLTVSEIAYKVGFDNLSYFSSSFKKLYGVAPKEYAAIKKEHG